MGRGSSKRLPIHNDFVCFGTLPRSGTGAPVALPAYERGERAPDSVDGSVRVGQKETADRAVQYRAQATEIRAAAERVKDADSRASLLRLADSYDRLAAHLEREGLKTGSDGSGAPT